MRLFSFEESAKQYKLNNFQTEDASVIAHLYLYLLLSINLAIPT